MKRNLKETWELAYCNGIKCIKQILKVTVDSKSREFQFKILHNILYTNEKLYKLNPVKFPTNLCSFCHAVSETIEHLFYNCKHTIGIWEAIITVWGKALKLRAVPSKICLILSDPDETLLLNFISLIVRKYIYSCKRKESLPVFRELYNQFKLLYKYEHFIAKKNHKLIPFLKKWTPLIPYVS